MDIVLYNSKRNKHIVVHSSIHKFVCERERVRERERAKGVGGAASLPLRLSQSQVFGYLKRMLRKLKKFKSKLP